MVTLRTHLASFSEAAPPGSGRSGLVFLYVTRKTTLPLRVIHRRKEKSVFVVTGPFSLTFPSSLSATGNVICSKRTPASKRRRIHVDAQRIPKACIPLWLSGGMIGFNAWETGVRFPVLRHIFMPPMLRSVSPPGATAEVYFCSQQARSTRLPATEHRFYGSRASLAKREWSVLAPLKPGDIHSSHILTLFRRLKMSVLHVVLHTCLQQTLVWLILAVTESLCVFLCGPVVDS